MDRESTFGELLKRHRRAAYLTQEALAERAGCSWHYVSMLERGVRMPPPATVDQLADALALRDAERAALHVAPAPLRPASMRLPALPPLDHLIGREQELAHLLRLFRDDGVWLVTLTGPGGVGKTALAQHAAAALAPAFRHGGALVDLSATSDPADVVPTVARALGVRTLGGRSLSQGLLAFLREREILLLLDGFERVVEAAPTVDDLLAACPQLKLLATSRVPLRLQREHEVRLPPLVLPPAEPSASARRLLETPAVALFAARARQAKPDLVLDDAAAALAAEICRRLDGLPLAIELAAARVTHLPLAALRDRLSLRLLTGGKRDQPQRQQRMRDTIAWSVDLLASPDQALLRRLSVFAGSWSLEAAEEVCALSPLTGGILDGLRSLVESSLVLALGDVADEARYRMLDTIHEYATEQLASSGELAALRGRHAAYCRRLAERAEPALQGRAHRVWYPRLAREQENLRAALQWLLAEGDGEEALRLAGAIWRFWQRHGDVREGRRWLEEGLACGPAAPAPVRAKALWGASWLAYYQGDAARMSALSGEHLAREHDDALETRNALTGLGMAALAEGRYREALALLQEAFDCCLPHGRTWHRATSSLNLGVAALLSGDLDRSDMTRLRRSAASRRVSARTWSSTSSPGLRTAWKRWRPCARRPVERTRPPSLLARPTSCASGSALSPWPISGPSGSRSSRGLGPNSARPNGRRCWRREETSRLR